MIVVGQDWKANNQIESVSVHSHDGKMVPVTHTKFTGGISTKSEQLFAKTIFNKWISEDFVEVWQSSWNGMCRWQATTERWCTRPCDLEKLGRYSCSRDRRIDLLQQRTRATNERYVINGHIWRQLWKNSESCYFKILFLFNIYFVLTWYVFGKLFLYRRNHESEDGRTCRHRRAD